MSRVLKIAFVITPVAAVAVLLAPGRDLGRPLRESAPPFGATAPAPGAPGAYQFLSPNTDEHLTLEEACRRLRSDEQRDFRRLAQDLLAAGGCTGHRALDALGDWSDGVENSIVVAI